MALFNMNPFTGQGGQTGIGFGGEGYDWPDWLNWRTGLAGMGGLFGVGGGLLDYFQKQAAEKHLERLAKSPLDIAGNYTPLSDAAKAAYQRALQANMQTAGIPLTGSYGSNMVAEGMAGLEAQLRQQATQTAQAQRQNQLQALYAGMGMRMPDFSGAFGGFANAYAANQREQEQRAASARSQSNEDRWYDLYKDTFKGPVDVSGIYQQPKQGVSLPNEGGAGYGGNSAWEFGSQT